MSTVYAAVCLCLVPLRVVAKCLSDKVCEEADWDPSDMQTSFVYQYKEYEEAEWDVVGTQTSFRLESARNRRACERTIMCAAM